MVELGAADALVDLEAAAREVGEAVDDALEPLALGPVIAADEGVGGDRARVDHRVEGAA